MADEVAIVTGAGSGVGRAVAIALARQQWHVILLGRTAASLRQTQQASGQGDRMLVQPTDIADPDSVRQMADAVLGRFGRVDAVVNCAGTNVPRRSLRELSLDDYRLILDANLNGLFHCAQSVLPAMRQAGGGTIININSIAGLRASALSGVAYVASKFGAAGLIQSINAEENAAGIRACSIFPGDINTPLLDKRPNPPPAEKRQQMLDPQDVAACVMLVLGLPPRAVVEELVIRPR
jgi:NAD(P)-dependent dehydrogenase (short-subunit alcohol dehydrogenase family)